MGHEGQNLERLLQRVLTRMAPAKTVTCTQCGEYPAKGQMWNNRGELESVCGLCAVRMQEMQALPWAEGAE